MSSEVSPSRSYLLGCFLGPMVCGVGHCPCSSPKCATLGVSRNDIPHYYQAAVCPTPPPAHFWAGPSALSLIYSQGHQSWLYGWVTNAVPQDPRLRRAPYLRVKVLPLLITLWKFFIILPLNLCFIREVSWYSGPRPGTWRLSSQWSYLPLSSQPQGPQPLEPTRPLPLNLSLSDSCHPLPLVET